MRYPRIQRMHKEGGLLQAETIMRQAGLYTVYKSRACVKKASYREHESEPSYDLK